MAGRSIPIDEKIKKAQEAVVKAKVKYDATVEELEKLMTKKQEMDNKKILKAFEESDRTLEETIEFFKGKVSSGEQKNSNSVRGKTRGSRLEKQN